MVQATLASMRYYCPDVQICLLVDGDVEVGDLQAEYELIVLRPRDLPDKNMTRLVSGNYRIKLSAMWEGPFGHYVWMDSDALVWGNFVDQVDKQLDFQIFWSEVSIEPNATEVPWWLGHFYYDLNRLQDHDPSFEWRGHRYFSAGVYAARRNAISYDQWMQCESWNDASNSELFRFGDQGILNYLVHAGAKRGTMKVGCSDLQYLPRHHGREEITKDTSSCGWSFPEHVTRPRAVHLCGQKPHMLNWRGYSHAFTIARLEHYRRNHSTIVAWVKVWTEEILVVFARLRSLLKRVLFGGLQGS